MGVYLGGVSLGAFSKWVAYTMLLQMKPKEGWHMGDSFAPLGVSWEYLPHEASIDWVGSRTSQSQLVPQSYLMLSRLPSH